MWEAERQATVVETQLHRVVPSRLHQSWLRRTTAQLRHHTSIPLFPPLALLLPLALVGTYALFPPSLIFFLNFISFALLTRLFILSSEVLVVNGSLFAISHPLAHVAHGFINSFLSCLGPFIIGVACISQNELRLAETFVAGCLISYMLLGTGSILLVGGILNMLDENGQGYTQHYSASSGTLWSLQTMLASATTLTIHVMAIGSDGSERYQVPSAELISRGAAIVMFSIHLLWLYFRYITHRGLFEDDPDDERQRPREETGPQPTRQVTLPWRSLGLLSWALVAVSFILSVATAVNLVNSTEGLAQTIHVSKTAVALTLLPLVCIVPTMTEALRAASNDRMDLALRLTLESSIDIAYYAFPALILCAWVSGKSLLMDFGYLQAIELGISVWLIARIFSSGRSTYLDGVTILSLYLIVSMANIALT